MTPEDRLGEAMFRRQLANSKVPLIASAVSSLLVTLVHWSSYRQPVALAWLGLVWGVALLRAGLLRRAIRQLERDGYDRGRATRFALSTGLSGIAWGAAALLTCGTDPLMLAVLVTVTQAMVMGGVLTLSPLLAAFLAFSIPATLPLAAVLALRQDAVPLSLAGCMLIFLTLMINIAWRFNISQRRNRQLNFDKEDLLAALTQAHDRLAVLAETDGLTGLANRRAFDKRLVEEFSRLRRNEVPFSLILLDVDHFKNFNDSYGHVEGDRCLKQISELFRKSLHRSADFAARYGGEEFIGILPDTDLAGAVKQAEHVRSAVEALNIPHGNSPTADHVTVSLGVVSLEGGTPSSPAEAVALADRQLYRAKSEGRNRVVAAVS